MPGFEDYEITRTAHPITPHPDVLSLCNIIADRYVLVARNFAATVPLIEQDIAANIIDERNAEVFRAMVRNRSDNMGQETSLRERLQQEPIAVAYSGLRAFGLLLRAYTHRAPEIFHGFDRVDSNPDWAKSLHAATFSKFGYYEEPLIGFALEMDNAEGTRFPTYARLFIGAINHRKLAVASLAKDRMPLLN